MPKLHSLALAVVCLACSPAGFAAEPHPEDSTIATTLVTALVQNDHAAFIAKGDDGFSKLSPAAFASAASALGPRLKAGHTLAYLGDLRQHGARVTLWKLTFQDGGDDGLATLVFKGDKVAGFWIK